MATLARGSTFMRWISSSSKKSNSLTSDSRSHGDWTGGIARTTSTNIIEGMHGDEETQDLSHIYKEIRDEFQEMYADGSEMEVGDDVVQGSLRKLSRIASTLTSLLGRNTDARLHTVGFGEFAAMVAHLGLPCCEERLGTFFAALPGSCYTLSGHSRVANARGVKLGLFFTVACNAAVLPLPLDVYIAVSRAKQDSDNLAADDDKLVQLFGQRGVDAIALQAFLARYSVDVNVNDACELVHIAQWRCEGDETPDVLGKMRKQWLNNIAATLRKMFEKETYAEKLQRRMRGLLSKEETSVAAEYDPRECLSYEEVQALWHVMITTLQPTMMDAGLVPSDVFEQETMFIAQLERARVIFETVPPDVLNVASRFQKRLVSNRLTSGVASLVKTEGAKKPTSKLETRIARLVAQSVQTATVSEKNKQGVTQESEARMESLVKLAEASKDVIMEHAERIEEAKETAEKQTQQLQLHQAETCETLDFSYSFLHQLPSELVDGNRRMLGMVKRLTLAGNKLSTLLADDMLLYLKRLEELDISCNEFMTLPNAMGRLTSLQVLRVSKNRLRDVPECVSKLYNLRLLDVCSCGLTAIPSFLTKLSRLEVLLFADNMVTALPDVPDDDWLQLRDVDASQNMLEDISPLLKRPNLAVLRASKNRLKSIDRALLGACENLIMINLSENALLHVEGLQRCSLLRVVELRSNRICGVPVDGIDWGRITKLDLSRNDILELHEDVLACLHNVQLLDLSHNHLRSLPDTIYHCKLLRELNLERNQVTYLPRRLAACKQLIKLHVAGNRLGESPQCGLPDTITVMPSLQYIDISDNNITMFPEIVGRCPRLAHVVAARNKIQSITAEHINSATFEHLEFQHNRIQHIFFDIGYVLTRLEYLDISYNEVERLPESIGLCPLKTLKAVGNCLVNIPATFSVLIEAIDCLELDDNPFIELPESLALRLHASETTHDATSPPPLGKLVGRMKAMSDLPNDALMDAPGTMLEMALQQMVRESPDTGTEFQLHTLALRQCPDDIDSYVRWVEARTLVLRGLVAPRSEYESEWTGQLFDHIAASKSEAGAPKRVYTDFQRATAGMLAHINVDEIRETGPIEFHPSISVSSSLASLRSILHRWTADSAHKSESMQREIVPAALVSKKRDDTLAAVRGLVEDSQLALIFKGTEYDMSREAIVHQASESVPGINVHASMELAKRSIVDNNNGPGGAAALTGSIAVHESSQHSLLGTAHGKVNLKFSSDMDVFAKMDGAKREVVQRHASRVTLREVALSKLNVDPGKAPKGALRGGRKYANRDVAQYAALAGVFAVHAEEEWFRCGGRYLGGHASSHDFVMAVVKRLSYANMGVPPMMMPTSDLSPKHSLDESINLSRFQSIFESSRPATAHNRGRRGSPTEGAMPMRSVMSSDGDLLMMPTSSFVDGKPDFADSEYQLAPINSNTNNAASWERPPSSSRIDRPQSSRSGGVLRSHVQQRSQLVDHREASMVLLAALSKSGINPMWNDTILAVIYHYFLRAQENGAIPFFGSLAPQTEQIRYAGKRAIKTYRSVLEEARKVFQDALDARKERNVMTPEELRAAAIAAAGRVQARVAARLQNEKLEAAKEAQVLNVFISQRAREMREADVHARVAAQAKRRLEAEALSQEVASRVAKRVQDERERLLEADLNPDVATSPHIRRSLLAIQSAAIAHLRRRDKEMPSAVYPSR